MVPVILSGRLQMLADMVTPGNRLVDVGCDHGYLAISLVGSGICSRAIAMDVREGPLAAARTHVAEAGLDDYISVRLSDGLAQCGFGEADTLICAGMGGRLMERILREGMEKARRMRELILQPQSELLQFRAFLRENRFVVIDEDAVFEGGKYYFAMKAVYGQGGCAYINSGDGEAEGVVEGNKKAGIIEERAERNTVTGDAAEAAMVGDEEAGRGRQAETASDGGREAVIVIAGEGACGVESGSGKPCLQVAAGTEAQQRLGDLYGEILLQKKHPVLLQYLRQREIYIKNLEESLAAAGTLKAQRRLEEVRGELEEIEAALAVYSHEQ